MKTYSFPYYFSLGKQDSVDGAIEYALSDKNAKRLERSAKTGGRFRLDEDEDVRDIFASVYEAIMAIERERLIADPTIVEDVLTWKGNHNQEEPISVEQINAYLNDMILGINYPEALQMLDKQSQGRIVQSQSESVCIERKAVQEFLKIPENKEKIIYVDEGKTLFYIPKNYSGLFILPTGISEIDEKSFKNHSIITEIVIENGIRELPQAVFDGCSSLKKITIPPSVKRIGCNTFSNCSCLEDIVFSEGLEEIDNTAFRLCTSLKKIYIPASVWSISALICSYWNGIKELHFLGMDTEIDDSRGGDLSRQLLYVRVGSKAEEFAKKHLLHFKIEQ